MLSLESIERRLEDPKAYYVFYEFFYKAAVGESRWKECMSNDEARIGNNTTEAFALLLFANNYKAWLYDEKKTHGDLLLTEYDTIDKTSIVDILLLNQEFNLEPGGEEKVIVDVAKNSYKKAAKKRHDWLRELKNKSICNEMKRSWEQLGSDEDETVTATTEQMDKKQRDQKKRKVMKGLKKWTGLADQGERKFKGWSDNGHRAYENWTMSIKDDVDMGRYTRWEKAYREVKAMNQNSSESSNADIDKYEVNRNVVWEL